ncbi:MAG: AglZ/HisF2 family acetamidino modification protein [Patescibacteria group bacterium]|nr:AglZ/HisF2 family acetamidino modification protein [Patescibacteria group bacterium]
MLKIRLMPCLLFEDLGLVKTIKFQNPTYIGDPINAVRIFNQKEVDELVFLDIKATRENRLISIKYINKLSDECFMPLTVGGGIRSLKDIKDLFNAGVEKVAINTYGIENPKFIKMAAENFGSQSILVSIDAKLNFNGQYEVYTHEGTKPTGLKPDQVAKEMERMGAGEIMINSIDRDGTFSGYDLKLIKLVADAVNIPVIACGGASSVEDFIQAVKVGHASAVAAGSFFVFYGARRAVLISFPDKKEIKKLRELKR